VSRKRSLIAAAAVGLGSIVLWTLVIAQRLDTPERQLARYLAATSTGKEQEALDAWATFEGGRLILVTESQLVESLVADAEVMRDLVHHGVAHDVGLMSRRRGHPLDRAAEDRDAVGKIRLGRCAVGQRNALVETEELATAAHLLWCRLVLDDDRDIAHAFAKLRGEAVERSCDQSCEASLPEA
jgi:hypothetical protein